MVELPEGTVTFLLTDVEGSTRLWEREPEAMARALASHDAIVAGAVSGNGGVLVKSRGEGDSSFSVFRLARDAVAAAHAAQVAIASAEWPVQGGLRVRMAVHSGDAELREGDYFGSAVNRCARLRAAAHGGQIVISAAVAELVREHLPAGCSLRDLGQHQLKDLALPEHVHQLIASKLLSEFPPLVSFATLPHNLPVQLTSFIGRHADMAALRKVLVTSRLVTITGPGGLGKTRLAIQLAAEESQEFPDGTWLVELAPVIDPQLVWRAATAALGLKEELLERSEAQLLQHLADRRLLLILDNCEHLLESSAQFCDELLRRCPRLTILATSRGPLRISGETIYPLGVLPPAEALPLFEDRARMGRPGFRLTEANDDMAAQLCARLEGIPLALELAAARMRSMGLEEIVERLDDRFRVLAGGARNLPSRQQTLRAVVDWSHELMTEPEQVVFRRLGVLRGGFRLDSSEAICAGDDGEAGDVDDRLSSICDRCLATLDEAGRYTMLETLREYAYERLRAAGEVDAVDRRHAEHFLNLSRELRKQLEGPGTNVAMRRYEEELDNLRAALLWSLEHDPTLCLSLGIVLTLFWQMGGGAREGRDWLERGLGRAGPSSPERSLALAGSGVLNYWLGEHEAAKGRFEAALDAAGSISGEIVTGRALNGLAQIAMDEGNEEHAVALWERCFELARRSKDRRSAAGIVNNLGVVDTRSGRHKAALTRYRESALLFQEAGDLAGAAMATGNAGESLLFLGDLSGARPLLEERLKLALETGDRPTQASALHGLGMLALAEGQPQVGQTQYLEALLLARDIGDAQVMSLALVGLGAAAADAANGLRLAGAGQALAEAIGHVEKSPDAVERRLEGHRHSLGSDGSSHAWESGRSMTAAQAIALATSV
jgi:predicted ATPase/class 3 adenylate cyclase